MKRVALLLALVMAYAALVVPFSHQLQRRSMIVKLGYTPSGSVVRPLAGEFRSTLAGWWVVQVFFYFGALLEKAKEQHFITPEYYNMYRTLSSAIKLDPYNKDAYYFAQAAFTWEVNRAREVNQLLEYGMRYRTWDWHLPFFAGFNAGYFLKDYETASRLMQKAAEISGSPVLARLASRYYYEAGREESAIAFLDLMITQATDAKERAAYQLRRDALQAVRDLSEAVDLFRMRFGQSPAAIEELVNRGVIAGIPIDPYGGEFYLDKEEKVRSTSRFAFGQADQKRKPE